MKRYSDTIILISLLIISSPSKAQDNSYKNRINLGTGGENSYLGIDYSRDLYKSKLFLGIGCGLGTGWTGYVRYEPVSWYGLSPFISSGISHSFGGTLIVSAEASAFSASAGVAYLPELKWRSVPILSIGMTYYSILSGDAEGGMNGFGPLIKLGLAFPRRTIKT
jgi:hypothetical protein